MLIWNPK